MSKAGSPRATGPVLWLTVAAAVAVCAGMPDRATGATAPQPGGGGTPPTAAGSAAKASKAASSPSATVASGTKATPKAGATKPAAPKAQSSAQVARARQVKLAQARAAARARAAREAAIPRFKLDAQGQLVPDLRAAAAIIYNPDTHEVLWEENGQAQRSIASITKVMTAVVFLESEPDYAARVKVERSDVLRASITYLRSGEMVSVDDLLHLLLIASDNAAARVLARVSPWGSQGFVARMNERANDLGLSSTRYADPSGLMAENVSSAYDMARLITYAAGDDRIASLMRLPEYQVTTSRRRVTIRNTNQLVKRADMDVQGGKTGFISRSGYCLATLLRLPEIDQRVAVVVLGARSNTGRFTETRNLFSWLSSKAHELFGRKAPARVPVS